MRFFWKTNSCPKKHLEVVFTTSNAKKWIFWTILRIFCPGKFFHAVFSFCCKSPWKSSKSHFFKKSRFFSQKMWFWRFSKAFTAKTNSPMKKFSTTKNAQNCSKNSFFGIKSWQNNFQMLFWAKIDFSKKWHFLFLDH